MYVCRGNPFQTPKLQQSTTQHNHSNRKNIIQNNKKYKCKNNTKSIYLTFVHRTCKCEKHKQSNVHEKQKQYFPSENYSRTFH